MSTIYKSTLEPLISTEMGDLDTSNLRYTSANIYSAIDLALGDFNVETPNQQYSLVGTGSTAYFTPDPTTEDKQLLVLFSARVLTNLEIQKAARTAYSHSNVAGKTDMTKISDALIKQAERIETRIKNAFDNRSRRLTEEELDESGVELKGRPTETAEGLGIIIIEETV